MQIHTVPNDIKVFGKKVTTFPLGIKEAYDALVEMVPDALKRSYYGISHMEPDGSIFYAATVEESHPGEGNMYDLEQYTIEKGQYLCKTLLNWLDKTDSVKDVFHELMQHRDADLGFNCVEWYKSDYEMVCLVRKK